MKYTALFLSVLVYSLLFFQFGKNQFEYSYEAANEALPKHLNLDITSSSRTAEQQMALPEIKKNFKLAKLRDKYYDFLTKNQFKKIRDDWGKYLFENNIRYIFELYDCDNYANAFKAFVETYNTELNLNIAVGKVIVINKHEFAFIRGGERAYHMLNCIAVDGEIYIFEPQNSISVNVSKYPNKEHILEVEI